MDKRCPKCGETKELSQFFRNRRTKDGLTCWCKSCHGAATLAYQKAHPAETAARHKAYRERHPEKVAEWNSTRANRAINLKARFDMTPEQYDELLAKQGGGCAICGQHRVRSGRYSMHIDHDHETGAVRGILCPHCNAGIGHFEDNPSRLLAAAEYLRRASREPTPYRLRADRSDRRRLPKGA